MSSGVVRKIDDLGRIVIPIEIRKSLKIRDGESLEISVIDKEIVLKKINIIDNSLTEIERICSSASDFIDESVIVLNREKVIYSSYPSIDKEFIIDEKLKSIIDERKTLFEYSSFYFNNTKLVGYYYIVPIISNGDALGLFILYSENKQIESNIVAKLIASIIAKCLDIS